MTTSIKQDRYYLRQIETLNTIKSKVNSIFMYAKENRKPHEYILERLKAEVWDSKPYIKLNQRNRAVITGYTDANFDVMWALCDWCHVYDGEFLGSAHNNPKTENLFKDGFDQSKLISFHAYKGTDKPYTQPSKV